MNIDMDAVIAELQKPNGWRKNTYGDWTKSNGPVCLIGALARVSRKSPSQIEFGMDNGPLMQVICEQFPDRVIPDWSGVPDFNDDEDTTLDDVILVCEKARARMGEVA